MWGDTLDCKTCKEQRKTVPYIVHEADMARQERTIKRLWIALILVIVLFVGSNCAWLWYESQFTDEVTTTESYEANAENDGVAIANGDGGVTYNG